MLLCCGVREYRLDIKDQGYKQKTTKDYDMKRYTMNTDTYSGASLV